MSFEKMFEYLIKVKITQNTTSLYFLGWITLMLPRDQDEADLKISSLYYQPILRNPLLTNVYRLKGKRVPGTPKFEVRKDYAKLFTRGKDLFTPRKYVIRKKSCQSVGLQEFKKLFNE